MVSQVWAHRPEFATYVLERKQNSVLSLFVLILACTPFLPASKVPPLSNFISHSNSLAAFIYSVNSLRR